MKLRFIFYYFVQYFTMGIIGPYFALYLYERQFSGTQIGLLLGSMPFAALLMQPAWSYLADVLNTRKVILALTSFGSAVSVAMMGLTGSFLWAFLFGILFSVFRSPLSPISNAILLDFLDTNDTQDDFGPIRMWGSLAFGISSLAMGAFFLDHLLTYFSWLIAGSYFVLAILALLLPGQGEDYTYAGLKGLNFIGKSPGFAIFLLASIFIGASLSISMNYQTLFLQNLQASDWLVGFSVSIQAFLEVPMMFLVPVLIRKFSLRVLILAGALILPLRWFLYLFIQDPAWVVPTQVMHGVAIVSFFVVGALFIDLQVPSKWRATGQGLYATAMHGIGSAIGLYLAGWVLDWLNVRAIWGLNLILGVLGLGFLIFALKRFQPSSQEMA